MNTFYGIMDFSKLLKIDCSKTDIINSRNLLLKYLKTDKPSYDFSNTTKFGYPNSNIFSVTQFNNLKDFNKEIISNILDYDNKNNTKYLNYIMGYMNTSLVFNLIKVIKVRRKHEKINKKLYFS